MTSLLTIKRPVLPGEALPPLPPKWTAPAPSLPPLSRSAS